MQTRKPHPRAPRIVVIGSSNTDLVIRCKRLPEPGETLMGGACESFAGGKGANQAVAAARAGAGVAFVGVHGRDDWGKRARAALRNEGIDTRFFRAKPGAGSGVAMILLGGRERQNMIAVARSANDLLSPQEVEKALPLIRRSRAVVAQLEVPLAAVKEAARCAAAADVPFILNPAPARKLPRSLLRLVHTLVPNEHEAAILAGTDTGADPRAAAGELLAMGCRQVVITLGARGALIADEHGMRRIASPRVKPVDTVGAGDCFTAWLSVGLAEGLSLEAAARRAVAAAALAVTRHGAQAGMPTRREVAQRFPEQ